GSLLKLDARSTGLALAARLSRLRGRRVTNQPARVAAFVHRAFWRPGASDGSAESYIGPVLREIETRIGVAEIRYVGVGPRANFRARRWWHPLLNRRALESGSPVIPIEWYAPASALKASARVQSDRHRVRESLWASADIRAHAVIKGCDCWRLVKEELAGIALLQFPWSARAMDEAAAALDATRPQ